MKLRGSAGKEHAAAAASLDSLRAVRSRNLASACWRLGENSQSLVDELAGVDQSSRDAQARLTNAS